MSLKSVFFNPRHWGIGWKKMPVEEMARFQDAILHRRKMEIVEATERKKADEDKKVSEERLILLEERKQELVSRKKMLTDRLKKVRKDQESFTSRGGPRFSEPDTKRRFVCPFIMVF
jgi:hypothetical protein